MCNICGTHAKELASHYKRYHPNDELQTPSKCQNLRDSVKGENNPAYQHGGRLSPFSKKFVNYDGEEKRKSSLKKQGETRKKNGTNPFTREFYDSDEEFSRAQTRDLEWSISKFGEEDGNKRHISKIEKWMNTLDSKSEEEKKRINRMKVGRTGSISKAEKDIIFHLKENGIVVADQFQLKKDNKGYYLYDIAVGTKIIEYHGDYWHCNPLFWDNLKYNQRLRMTAEEKWKIDKEKENYAIKLGYDVLVIWEHDCKNDKQGTLQKCLSFLTQ